MAQSVLQWLKQASKIDVTASAIARHTIPEHELKLLPFGARDRVANITWITGKL